MKQWKHQWWKLYLKPWASKQRWADTRVRCLSVSESVSEVFGHALVRTRVRVRSHDFVRVHVRVRVRASKKSRVRVRTHVRNWNFLLVRVRVHVRTHVRTYVRVRVWTFVWIESGPKWTVLSGDSRRSRDSGRSIQKWTVLSQTGRSFRSGRSGWIEG